MTYIVLDNHGVNAVVSVPFNKFTTKPEIHGKDTGMKDVLTKIFCDDVWFKSAATQKEFALSKGYKLSQVYVNGQGGEDLNSCLKSFDGREGGRLGFVGGLYILAQDTETLRKRLALLEEREIYPFDAETGETNQGKLWSAFTSRVMGSKKFKADPKAQKRTSSKGGQARAEKEAAKRERILAENIVRRLRGCPALTVEMCVDILVGDDKDSPFSRSTFLRNYKPLVLKKWK